MRPSKPPPPPSAATEKPAESAPTAAVGADQTPTAPAPAEPPIIDAELIDEDQESVKGATIDAATETGDGADGAALESLAPEELEEIVGETAETTGDVEDAERQRVQREVEKHMFGIGPKKKGKGISLTLLDGTTIRFGASVHGKRSGANLTQEDLIGGLRAKAAGTSLEDFLPSDKWEDYVAALLEILMRKHLVMFEELVTALKRNNK